MKRYAIANANGVVDKSHRVLFRSVEDGVDYLERAGLFGDYMVGNVKIVLLSIVA